LFVLYAEQRPSLLFLLMV